MSDINKARVVGSTSNIVEIEAFDTATGKPKTGLAHNTSNLVIYAQKNEAAAASIGTLADATIGAFTSGGFKEHSTIPGRYQVGVPNAQWDTAGKLKISGRITSDDTVYFKPVGVDVLVNDPYADVLQSIADALRDDAIAMLEDGMTLGDTSWSLKDSAGNTVTITISRVARNAIASTAATP